MKDAGVSPASVLPRYASALAAIGTKRRPSTPQPAEGEDYDEIDPDDRLNLLVQMIRAASELAPPPEQADLRSLLPVRRYRSRSGPDVP